MSLPLPLSPSLAGVLDFLLSDTPVPIHYQNMAAATKSSFFLFLSTSLPSPMLASWLYTDLVASLQSVVSSRLVARSLLPQSGEGSEFGGRGEGLIFFKLAFH